MGDPQAPTLIGTFRDDDHPEHAWEEFEGSFEAQWVMEPWW